MKLFNNFSLRHFRNIFIRKKNFIEPTKLFEVLIYTTHHSTFLVKYSHSGKSVIEESMVGTWKKLMQIPQAESLKFHIYITNPTENKKLKCQIEVNELTEENSVINTTKFSFPVGCTLESWVWKTFEV